MNPDIANDLKAKLNGIAHRNYLDILFINQTV